MNISRRSFAVLSKEPRYPPRKPIRDFDGLPIDLAIQQAKKSKMRSRVGAVLFQRDRVFACGFSHHGRFWGEDGRSSIHAEEDCISGMRADLLRDCDLLIVRINVSGNLLPIEPCKRCMSLLARKGLRKIYYWDQDLKQIGVLL